MSFIPAAWIVASAASVTLSGTVQEDDKSDTLLRTRGFLSRVRQDASQAAATRSYERRSTGNRTWQVSCTENINRTIFPKSSLKKGLLLGLRVCSVVFIWISETQTQRRRSNQTPPLPHNYICRYLAGVVSVSARVGRGSWNDSGISRAETLTTQACRRQAKARSRILILGQIISRRENFCAYH